MQSVHNFWAENIHWSYFDGVVKLLPIHFLVPEGGRISSMTGGWEAESYRSERPGNLVAAEGYPTFAREKEGALFPELTYPVSPRTKLHLFFINLVSVVVVYHLSGRKQGAQETTQMA